MQTGSSNLVFPWLCFFQVMIQNKKIDLSHVTSKCGSLDNIHHRPGNQPALVERNWGDLTSLAYYASKLTFSLISWDKRNAFLNSGLHVLNIARTTGLVYFWGENRPSKLCLLKAITLSLFQKHCRPDVNKALKAPKNHPNNVVMTTLGLAAPSSGPPLSIHCMTLYSPSACWACLQHYAFTLPMKSVSTHKGFCSKQTSNQLDFSFNINQSFCPCTLFTLSFLLPRGG